MHRIVRVKSDIMFPAIREILDAGGKANITVTGSSMMPFLRSGIDSVELSKVGFDMISRGDIVLIQRDTGPYVLHRVIKKEDRHFYMVGDNQQWIEGPLRPEQIVATVTSIFRKDKKVDINNFYLRILVNIWLILLPYRFVVKRVFYYPYMFMKQVYNKLNH